MREYDHYVCDVSDLGEALNQIGEEGETIISTTCFADRKVLIITEKNDIASLKAFADKKKK